MEIFGALIALIGLVGFVAGLIIYNSFAWGYVSHVTYGWFILPFFPNLPNLDIYQFVGISFFANVIIRTSHHDDIKDEYKDNKYKTAINVTIGPWVSLLCAWIIYSWYF